LGNYDKEMVDVFIKVPFINFTRCFQEDASVTLLPVVHLHFLRLEGIYSFSIVLVGEPLK